MADDNRLSDDDILTSGTGDSRERLETDADSTDSDTDTTDSDTDDTDSDSDGTDA